MLDEHYELRQEANARYCSRPSNKASVIACITVKAVCRTVSGYDQVQIWQHAPLNVCGYVDDFKLFFGQHVPYPWIVQIIRNAEYNPASIFGGEGGGRGGGGLKKERCNICEAFVASTVCDLCTWGPQKWSTIFVGFLWLRWQVNAQVY